MKSECAAAIQAAAGDRKLSDGELRDIEERLFSSAKVLRRQDPDTWAQMGVSERYAAAAKHARAAQTEQMAYRHAAELDRIAKKTRNDAIIGALKPGEQTKGMLAQFFSRAGRFDSASLEATIHAEQTRAATQFSGKDERFMEDPTKTLALAKELKGEDSGDAEAKGVAAKVAAVFERQRQRMVRAGIPVNHLDSYGMPQPWDSYRFTVEPEEFVNDMLRWSDHREYTNRDGSPMSLDQIKDFLHQTWLTLHTNGANKRTAGTALGSGRTGGKYNAPRQLHFKDAESWYAAMKKYGVSDNMGSIVREALMRRARDTTIAEHQGYNADRDVQERLARAVESDMLAARSEKEKRRIDGNRDAFLRRWKVMQHGQAVGNAAWAARMGLVRNLMTTSKIGNLFSQQPSDFIMAANLLKTMGFDRPAGTSLVRELSPGERKAALRSIGIWSDNMHATTDRFTETELYNRASRFLNGTVYKMSGMRKADQVVTGFIGDSIFDGLGRHSHKTEHIEDLPAALRDEFVKRYGITQEHWDVMRMAQLDRGPRGDRTTLTPDSIHDIPDEALRGIAESRLSQRYGDQMPKDLDRAVTDEIARLKDETISKMLGAFREVWSAAGRGFSGSTLTEQDRLGLLRNPAGTLAGEVIRMLSMIRSVPFGMAMTHLWDIPKGLSGGWAPKARYVAGYLLGQSLATGIAVQLKHLVAGEDLEDPESKAFLEKVAAGGLTGPLMATILFGSNGESGSTAGKLLGPAGDAVVQMMDLYTRGLDEAEGKPPGKRDRFAGDKYATQWMSFVRSNATPFMNIWYIKALFNHLAYQQAQEAVSSGYNDRVRSRLQQEGRGQWWANGDVTPQRAPVVQQDNH